MCIQALQPSVRIPACLLFAQFHHSSDASSGTFNHILRQLDFFSAASFQTVINIHQCCDLHIHTCQWNSQRIERLVRTIKLQMFYNTVFRSDNKFSAVRFLGIIHNTCCGSDIIGLFNHFLTAFRMHQKQCIRMGLARFLHTLALTTICLGHPPL